ncbi:MRG/MORF4L-binding protein [Ochlerotatus camptorhynchus]|uniref:MRG/MORF4L-binding protein n=1 Tax=Ochlerotatus camptorhynchus TaxID=644619 RepID=UPI0031D201FE
MTTTKDKPEVEYSEWSPEDEIQLFFAMDGLRPVGINRHFTIACIVERLSKALNRDVSSESVWSYLKTMYNLKALDEQEQHSYPTEESDFSLPEAEFSTVMKRKSIEEPIMEDSKKADQTKITEPITKPTKEKETSDKEKSVEKEKDTKSSKTKIDNQDSTPKRPQKRTRGSMSLEPNASSPASTPPNVQSSKRRRI